MSQCVEALRILSTQFPNVFVIIISIIDNGMKATITAAMLKHCSRYGCILCSNDRWYNLQGNPKASKRIEKNIGETWSREGISHGR